MKIDFNFNNVFLGDCLTVLQKNIFQFVKKVKFICIDPPYNTRKKKRSYKDNWKGHKNFHEFIYPILKISRECLTENGVFCIFISDNEQAQLKIMLNEIYGEENFIGTIVWECSPMKPDSKYLSVSHNYIHCYSYDKEQILVNKCYEIKDKHYKKDFKGKYCLVAFTTYGTYKNLLYCITDPKTKNLYFPPKAKSWKVVEKKFQDLLNDDKIVFTKNLVYKKVYLEESADKGCPEKTFWDTERYGSNSVGTQELSKIFQKKKDENKFTSVIFDTTKPTKVLKKLIKLFGDDKENNYVAMDFFAGSGSFGDAIMQLNKEDGGKRKFVLIQNEEKLNNGVHENIYDLTKDRIERVNKNLELNYKINYLF